MLKAIKTKWFVTSLRYKETLPYPTLLIQMNLALLIVTRAKICRTNEPVIRVSTGSPDEQRHQKIFSAHSLVVVTPLKLQLATDQLKQYNTK